MRPRLLVCAYAFSPVLGSEFAQGWNYVQQMAKYFRVTVLVGSSDGRMGDFEALRQEAVTSMREVELCPVQMDAFCRIIRYLDVKWGMSWLFVIALRQWHKRALRVGIELHRREPFDAVHQLGPVGFRNPGFLYKLGIPSYWGPVGGFQYISLRLAIRSSFRYFLTSLVRNASTYLTSRSNSLMRAVRGFSRTSFATNTNRENFRARFGVDGPVLSDQAIERCGADAISMADKAGFSGGDPVVLWCGSVDGRKNIALMLEVASQLQVTGSRFRVRIIGDGPMLDWARRRAESLGLERVSFDGKVSRERVREAMEQATAICFTSLSEANTSTLFEAIEALCVPLALDLDGFSTNISDDMGFLVSTSQSYVGIIGTYVERVRRLEADEQLLTQMRSALLQRRQVSGWGQLGMRHRDMIMGMLGKGLAAGAGEV